MSKRVALRTSGDDELRIHQMQLGEFLSEDIVPSDWAALVATVAQRIDAGQSHGIVVTHGLDTLPYTAALLHWLFSGSRVPVVLAAALEPAASGGKGFESLIAAFRHLDDAQGGVHVAFHSRVMPACNLRFDAVKGSEILRTWNPSRQVLPPRGEELVSPDAGTLTRILEDAVSKTAIVKIYPGLRSEQIVSLIRGGVRYLVLELFDTGTAGLRPGPYSIRTALTEARAAGAAVFCTSQQEGFVDFADFVSSHDLWREGAIPMGALSTESTYAAILASLLTGTEPVAFLEDLG
mgnify:FL=1